MSSLKATFRTGALAVGAVLLPAVPVASPASAAPARAPLPAYATTHTARHTAGPHAGALHAPAAPFTAPRLTAYVNADDAAGLTVTPASPAPGTGVTLRLTNCEERTALAVSPVFAADVRLTASGGTLTGESRIRSTVRAGTYDVHVVCGDTGRIGTITIGGARRPPRTAPPRTAPARPDPALRDPARPDPVRPAPARPEPARPESARPAPVRPAPVHPEPVHPEPVHPEPVHPEPGKTRAASPVAPVEAGGGGTARLGADEVRETGPGAGHVVTGLVLASVAAGAVVLGGVRRRSRRAG